MTEIQNSVVSDIQILVFGICFEFRASDFEFDCGGNREQNSRFRGDTGAKERGKTTSVFRL
jgi:hypothetical protein